MFVRYVSCLFYVDIAPKARVTNMTSWQEQLNCTILIVIIITAEKTHKSKFSLVY